MPNLYETLLIVTPDADDEGINAVVGDLRNTIENDGGSVLQAGVWQRRQLAYPVQGKTEGIYVLVYADGEESLPAALRDRMRLDEAVIRSLVVRLEDQHEADVREKIAADGEGETSAAEQRAAAERRAQAAAQTAAMSLAEMEAAEAAAEEQEPGEPADAEGTDEGPSDSDTVEASSAAADDDDQAAPDEAIAEESRSADAGDDGGDDAGGADTADDEER